MGNKNSGRRRGEKVFDGYLRKILNEPHDGTQYRKAEAAARKLVEGAIEGRLDAMKELLERMDGKVTNVTANTHDISGKLEITKRVVKG